MNTIDRIDQLILKFIKFFFYLSSKNQKNHEICSDTYDISKCGFDKNDLWQSTRQHIFLYVKKTVKKYVSNQSINSINCVHSSDDVLAIINYMFF
jgi:hypothetical protein